MWYTAIDRNTRSVISHGTDLEEVRVDAARHSRRWGTHIVITDDYDHVMMAFCYGEPKLTSLRELDATRELAALRECHTSISTRPERHWDKTKRVLQRNIRREIAIIRYERKKASK